MKPRTVLIVVVLVVVIAGLAAWAAQKHGGSEVAADSKTTVLEIPQSWGHAVGFVPRSGAGMYGILLEATDGTLRTVVLNPGSGHLEYELRRVPG